VFPATFCYALPSLPVLGSACKLAFSHLVCAPWLVDILRTGYASFLTIATYAAYLLHVCRHVWIWMVLRCCVRAVTYHVSPARHGSKRGALNSVNILLLRLNTLPDVTR